ncbi:MAG: alkaline phosphatase family protein [Chloroflexota bacterium]
MLRLFRRRRKRRVLVVGLDCAPPSVLFRTCSEHHLGLKDQLPNLSRLIDEGIYGPLSSSIPCITVPAWSSMLSSKDPGVLGFYGFRNRADYSYDRMSIATGEAVQEPRIWDVLGEAGRSSVVIGVPQTYPVEPIEGCLVSSFLTPNTDRQYTFPNNLRQEIDRVLDGAAYDVDVPDFRTSDKAFLLRQIQEMTEKRFRVIRYLMKEKAWDFFMFVEIGLDRIHHGLWKFWDQTHAKYEPGNPYEDAIPAYYRYLDRELGRLLGMIGDETVVLVVSDHGGQPMEGGLAVNEWLRREGLLVLRDDPLYEGLVPFEKVEVDWEQTTAWGAGGYYARIFMNVKGREPWGKIPADEYEQTRDELKERIEAIPDHRGNPMGSVAFKPQDLYQEVRNVAPDLMVYLGNLRWRAVGSFGLPEIYTFENDIGPDDANHAQDGIFILWDPREDRRGRCADGLQLMDVAPTVLDLMGIQVPPDMQGQVIER